MYAFPCFPIVYVYSSFPLQLFLPIVQIFGLEDTIPFHVQLTGPVSSLREFLPKPGDCEKATIVGSLVRQIVVDLGVQRVTRTVVIGDAKMSPRPPGAAADAHEASLDWDGEVRCKADTMVGMFDAGCVRIQVSLCRTSPLNKILTHHNRTSS